MEATLEVTIRERLASEKARTEPPPGAIPIPTIPVSRYRDDEFWDLEQEHLWKKTWLYAAHVSELSEPGAYKVFEHSGAPILIVCGNDGQIRAFYNSCRHRGAPVVRDECGTAKRLTCQYHSWSYGLEGQLKAVPDSRSFAGLDKDALGLVPVRCEVVDGWVFVNEDPKAEPLIDFLGPLVEQMAEINGEGLRVIGTQTHHVPANWKAMVDAFLEVYHIRTVHPDNAALLYDDQTVTVSMLPNGHSRLSVGIHEGMVGVMDPSPAADNPSVGQLWRDTSTSFGWFPNIVAPLDTGAFPLLCMWPVDVRNTALELVWLAPDWGEGETPEENTLRMTLFETVMGQDTMNMGGIQKSIDSPGARPFQIGWHERLIYNFHRAIDLCIGEENLPESSGVTDALDSFVETS